jgi:hypothetical protein
MDCKRAYHVVLIGVYSVGSIHSYNHSLYGSGDFDGCTELIRQTLLPLLRAQLGFACCHPSPRPALIVAMDTFPKVAEMLHVPLPLPLPSPLPSPPDNSSSNSSNSGGLLAALSPRLVRERGQRVCEQAWESLAATDFPGLPHYRVQRACFGAAIMYTIMTDVYNISMHEEGAFWPLDKVRNSEISWTVGSVALDAFPFIKAIWTGESN